MQRLLLYVSFLFAVLWIPVGCSHQSDGANEPVERLDGPPLTKINPGILLKGTLIVVSGSSFITNENGTSYLQFRGELDGNSVFARLPARFVDFDRMEVDWPGGKAAGMPSNKGTFVGSVRLEVESRIDNELHFSEDLPNVELQIVDQLVPQLDSVASSDLGFINDLVSIEGDGFLLGGKEGNTVAVVEGTFTPQNGDPFDVGPVDIPCVSKEPYDRTQLAFPFSPRIAGIAPGSFEGTVRLRNDPPDGTGEDLSDHLPFSWNIRRPLVTRLSTIEPVSTAKHPPRSDAAALTVSMGQYLFVEGSGFVGGTEGGTTSLQLSGTLTLPDDTKIDLVKHPLKLLPEFVSGQKVRYVVGANDQLSERVNIRFQWATFTGDITPTITYPGSESETGATPLGVNNLRFSPPKQVVWVRFKPLYVESLRHFGLRATEERIRRRIFDIAARDYAGVNIEFVAEEPVGFAAYQQVEIQGPDPNLDGMFGYDNTSGKDTCNFRLFDKIGGVNATSQASDVAAYGGVFVESFFAFSPNPGVFARALDSTEPLFDVIFDPLRPDRKGTAVNAEDLRIGIPEMDPDDPSAAEGCPDIDKDRPHQIACAIWTLGSLIGTTMTHETGHSLGLASPYDCSSPHDPADGVPGRLMNSGGYRSFQERIEMGGEGPSRFCDLEYQYLRWILPTTEPEPDVERPDCGYSLKLDEAQCGTKTCEGQ